MRKFLSLSDIKKSGDKKTKVAPMGAEEKKEMRRIMQQARFYAAQAEASARKVKVH